MNQTIDAKNKRVFLDADVLISSLISKTGAAWYLVNEVKNLNISTSTAIINEFHRIAKRNSLEIEKRSTNSELRYFSK